MAVLGSAPWAFHRRASCPIWVCTNTTTGTLWYIRATELASVGSMSTDFYFPPFPWPFGIALHLRVDKVYMQEELMH